MQIVTLLQLPIREIQKDDNFRFKKKYFEILNLCNVALLVRSNKKNSSSNNNKH